MALLGRRIPHVITKPVLSGIDQQEFSSSAKASQPLLEIIPPLVSFRYTNVSAAQNLFFVPRHFFVFLRFTNAKTPRATISALDFF